MYADCTFYLSDFGSHQGSSGGSVYNQRKETVRQVVLVPTTGKNGFRGKLVRCRTALAALLQTCALLLHLFFAEVWVHLKYISNLFQNMICVFLDFVILCLGIFCACGEGKQPAHKLHGAAGVCVCVCVCGGVSFFISSVGGGGAISSSSGTGVPCQRSLPVANAFSSHGLFITLAFLVLFGESYVLVTCFRFNTDTRERKDPIPECTVIVENQPPSEYMTRWMWATLCLSVSHCRTCRTHVQSVCPKH